MRFDYVYYVYDFRYYLEVLLNQDCSGFFLLQYRCRKCIFLLRKRMEMSDTSICNAFNMHPLMVRSYIYDTISFILGTLQI